MNNEIKSKSSKESLKSVVQTMFTHLEKMGFVWS
jgi:hypothetical protein